VSEENCALLSYCAANNVNSWLMFR